MAVANTQHLSIMGGFSALNQEADVTLAELRRKLGMRNPGYEYIINSRSNLQFRVVKTATWATRFCLNSPNVYQKVEVLETGTSDPKKITKVEYLRVEAE